MYKCLHEYKNEISTQLSKFSIVKKGTCYVNSYTTEKNIITYHNYIKIS